MIKIKNKKLIYFTFYINNISFLKNEKVDNQVSTEEQTLTKEQIHNQVSKNEEDKQIHNQVSTKEQTSTEKKIHNEKRILKFKFSDYKNNWLTIILVFSGISLFFILFFIYKRKNKEIPEKELYEKIIKILKEKQIELYLYTCVRNDKKDQKKVFKILNQHYSFFFDMLIKEHKQYFKEKDFYNLIFKLEEKKKILIFSYLDENSEPAISGYYVNINKNLNKDYFTLYNNEKESFILFSINFINTFLLKYYSEQDIFEKN